MELTKEHFDQTLKGLATKADLQAAVKPLATYEQVESLARMTSRGFEDVLDRLDVRERMQLLESDMKKIKTALQIS